MACLQYSRVSLLLRESWRAALGRLLEVWAGLADGPDDGRNESQSGGEEGQKHAPELRPPLWVGLMGSLDKLCDLSVKSQRPSPPPTNPYPNQLTPSCPTKTPPERCVTLLSPLTRHRKGRSSSARAHFPSPPSLLLLLLSLCTGHHLQGLVASPPEIDISLIA